MADVVGKEISMGNDVYAEWMGGWELYPRPDRLPNAPNSDGRPVWEPPILDYSEYIGEKYEKKRKAMLEYTGGDVARTTGIMDIDTEYDLLWEYVDWAQDNAESAVDSKTRKFFRDLRHEAGKDWLDAGNRWRTFDGGFSYFKNEDGTYQVRVLNWRPQTEITSTNSVPQGISEEMLETSSAHGTDSNNISNSIPPTTEYSRISSPTDDDEELAWLDSLDSPVSTYSLLSPNPAQPRGTTSLALRIISLHSKTTFHDSQPKQREINEGDGLD